MHILREQSIHDRDPGMQRFRRTEPQAPAAQAAPARREGGFPQRPRVVDSLVRLPERRIDGSGRPA